MGYTVLIARVVCSGDPKPVAKGWGMLVNANSSFNIIWWDIPEIKELVVKQNAQYQAIIHGDIRLGTMTFQKWETPASYHI